MDAVTKLKELASSLNRSWTCFEPGLAKCSLLLYIPCVGQILHDGCHCSHSPDLLLTLDIISMNLGQTILFESLASQYPQLPVNLGLAFGAWEVTKRRWRWWWPGGISSMRLLLAVGGSWLTLLETAAIISALWNSFTSVNLRNRFIPMEKAARKPNKPNWHN